MSDLSMIDEGAKAIVGGISSSFARAKYAKTCGDTSDELKHLLHAIQDISVLMLRHGGGFVTDDIAKSYAATLVSSSARIRDILFAGGTIQ